VGESASQKYWPRIRAAAVMLGALLVTAALVGTFSPSTGPLGKSGAGGEECAPDQPGHWVAVADAVENFGSTPVMILSVRPPADARNVRMSRAWIVPIYHDPKTGNFELAEPGVPTWNQRQPAVGAVIRPAKGPAEAVTLEYGVMRTTTATAGRSDPPVITYKADGTTFAVQQGWSVVLGDQCALPA